MIERVIRNLASLKLQSCGIAVSGGSDSMALLHMLTDWESDNKPEIIVASIDHGLRTESKSEVEFVKKICQLKKIKHFGYFKCHKIHYDETAKTWTYPLVTYDANKNKYGPVRVRISHMKDW